MKQFYPVTPELTETLRQGKLTAAEWRIWSYLITIDPWGNQYKDVETLTVMSVCEVSKATYYRAIAKFDELELFDFQDKGFSIKNRYGATSLKNETPESLDGENQSQICETSLKNETRSSEMRQDPQICENRSPEPAPSNSSKPSKIIKIIKTNKKEREGEILKFLESTPSFRDFCLRKAQGLPSVPVLLDSWIVANFDELEGLWAKSQTSSGVQNSARPAVVVVEAAINKYPQVQERIDRGELKQDPIFPEGVYDEQGGWWKKADLEELIHVH
ncbi:hypothetical protein [Microcoleus sp. SVA1_A1]|uniref:hypothetical protein n=1 Tax=Microcoleus sp. SVA1_A1 TaxID=2818946 RepID=UPI002FD1DDD4